MKITSYKTKKVIVGDNLYKILDQSLPLLKERDILAISSKIISICQGRVIKKDGRITKENLIKKEADLILPKKYIRYGVNITITNNMLISSAGIDESNSNGYFVLWPEDPQKAANEIRSFLRKKFGLRNLGVIISDSHSSLLRRGTLGFSLAWTGFKAIRNYIGKPDIFGKNLEVTQTNLVDALTASAVVVMGEGSEQTPLAVISETSNVEFVDKNPTDREIKELMLTLDEDVYSAPLSQVKWIKGGK